MKRVVQTIKPEEGKLKMLYNPLTFMPERHKEVDNRLLQLLAKLIERDQKRHHHENGEVV